MFLTPLSAQEVTDVVAKQNGDLVEVTYTLHSQADIIVLLSQDGGNSYSQELQSLTGDFGKNVNPGRRKIVWNLKQEKIRKDIPNARFKIVARSLGKKKFDVNGVSFVMIAVDGGTFTMGATEEQGKDGAENERPKHNVTLDSYYIGETEVTQELWEAVMGTTVQQQKDKEGRSFSLCGKGALYPIYYVSWYECQQFIEKLNYLLSNILMGKQFTLPSEAQWEFAARGGNKSKKNKYSGSDTAENVAWISSNSGQSVHIVKTKLPNELEIYDMSGNVWEWCQDRYGSYKSFTQKNPVGDSGYEYVYRGGSWNNDQNSCRTTCRVHDPGRRSNRIGFRLVLQ